MKRQYSITVRGKSGAQYGFTFVGHPEHIEGWIAEGFDITEVLNTIPAWAVAIGLTRPWCAAQDLWRWMRLW